MRQHARGKVTCVAFDHNAATLVAGKTLVTSMCYGMHVWKLGAQTEGESKSRENLPCRDLVSGITFCPDDRYFICVGKAGMGLWDFDGGFQIRVLSGHVGPINCVAWSLDGQYIVSGGDDKSVCLWEVDVVRMLSV
jgi:WD40 repeat protein